MRSMYSVSRRSRDSETLRVTRGPVKSAGCPGPYLPTCDQAHRLLDSITDSSSSSLHLWSADLHPDLSIFRNDRLLLAAPGPQLQAEKFLLFWGCCSYWHRRATTPLWSRRPHALAVSSGLAQAAAQQHPSDTVILALSTERGNIKRGRHIMTCICPDQVEGLGAYSFS